MVALHTVFIRRAVLESRMLVQVIPEHVQKLWNNWGIRVLVLVSLTLQLCLLHFGCRRRYSAKTWLGVFLWISFLGADSVANVALGIISNNQGNCDDSKLQVELISFWAPFLLLHLGGQDTITAYAVQDNELWLRHLLGLVVQSVVALYIILLSWKVSWLSFLTIPLFLAGFIKYAERTWVLKSANNVMSSDEYVPGIMDVALGRTDSRFEPPSRYMNVAIFRFFKVFRCLFLNQKAVLLSNEQSYSDFIDSKTAWNTIEGELGYAYDVYYTKAPLFFTTWGFVIRAFSFTSIFVVFVLFLILESHKHPFVDLIVTYTLLVGAIILEISGFVLLCSSDWPFQRYGNGLFDNCVEELLTPIRSGGAKLTSKRRWSNSMCQLDMLGLCLKDMSLQSVDGTTPTLSSNLSGWSLKKLLHELNGELELLSYVTSKEVSAQLKEFVFRSFLAGRGWDSNGFVPEKYNEYITNKTESIETYQRIIIWHVATDFCFYTATSLFGGDESDLLRDVSKGLSDYMMYILAMHPTVLSTGNANRIFDSTCKAVKLLIEKEKLSSNAESQVCHLLLSLECWSEQPVYKALLEDQLFPLGVLLAIKLRRLSRVSLWELLSSFWFENLVYVASLCPGNKHAQLLRNGGEFLTHVWLLEEHFLLSIRARSAAAVREEAEHRSVASDNASVQEEAVQRLIALDIAAIAEFEAMLHQRNEAVVSSVVGDDAAVVEEEEVTSQTMT